MLRSFFVAIWAVIQPIRWLIVAVLGIGIPLYLYLAFVASEPVFTPDLDVDLGRQTAAAIAQTQIEQFQRTTWASVAPTVGWTTPVAVTNPQQGVAAQDSTDFSISWRISDVEPGWTRSVDVRVVWDEPNRPGREFAISTLRYNREGT